MGSLTVGIGSGGQMRLDVFLISQNQGGNYSTIGVRGYLINTTGSRSFKNDAIPMSIYGTAGHDAPSGFNVAAHSEQLVIARDFDIGHDANGFLGTSFGFHVGATGTTTFGGGGDAAPVNDGWPRIPKPPNPPTIVIPWVESNRAGIAVSVPGDENGAGADVVNYRVHRNSDGLLIGDMLGPYSGVAFPGLTRFTDYVAFAQTHNIAGWGGWSSPVGFKTLAEAPTSPGTSADQIKPTSARIVVTASSDDGGNTITAYETYVMSNNAYPGAGGAVVASATGGTFTATGLSPSKQYFYTSRSMNASGYWSPWTPMKAFTTLPSANINVAGVWKNAIPWVNDAGGVPRMAIPYKNVGGIWKQ